MVPEGNPRCRGTLPARRAGVNSKNTAPFAKKEKEKKGLSLCTLARAEVIASHSSLLSPHCMHCAVLPALFPALAYIRVITYWGISTYAEKTLHRACFSGTGSPRALRDLTLDGMHATDLLLFR